MLHTVPVKQSFDVLQGQVTCLDLEQEVVLRLRGVQIIEPVCQDGVRVGRGATHVCEALGEGDGLLWTLILALSFSQLL